MIRYDLVDAFALLLLAIGVAALAWGIHLHPPASFNELFINQYSDWTSGLVIDGVLLLVLNRVIHRHERKRVVSQVASLSNEFALDAVRRCRAEGWLHDGTMEAERFTKARLSTADLSDAKLRKVDLRFADLTGTDLTHADLHKANLAGANLSGADLRWSDLSDADLSWADLRGALLDGASLTGARTAFTSIDPEHREFGGFPGAVVGGFLAPEQVALVKAGFNSLLNRGDAPILRFYENLFATAPALRTLFATDIERQARKFLQSLKVIVSGLSATEKAAPVLQKLGERHKGYGVQASHYDEVGRALIATLAETLGPDFSGEMREAWIAAFNLISSLMRGGTHATSAT